MDLKIYAYFISLKTSLIIFTLIRLWNMKRKNTFRIKNVEANRLTVTGINNVGATFDNTTSICIIAKDC